MLGLHFTDVMACDLVERYQHSGSIFDFMVTVFCAVLQYSLIDKYLASEEPATLVWRVSPWQWRQQDLKSVGSWM